MVLISDGGANVGVTDVEVIARHASTRAPTGSTWSGPGLAMPDGTYNDDLMDTVTDAGKGASVFIGDEAEADEVFDGSFVTPWSSRPATCRSS